MQKSSQSIPDDFDRVMCFPARSIFDLVAATGTRGGNNHIVGLLADRWEQYELADPHG
jgi:hypothetical protein